jgi:uncharacterized membrane protein
MKLRAKIPFVKSGLLKPMLVELVICSIHTPPHIDYAYHGKMLGGTYIYSIDDIVVVVSLVKCLIVFRLYYHYSKWGSSEEVEKLCN